MPSSRGLAEYTLEHAAHLSNYVATKNCCLKYLMSCGNGYDSKW